MFRWIYLFVIWGNCLLCSGQNLDYFCPDLGILKRDAKAASIITWLQPIIDAPPPPIEIVQTLLSPIIQHSEIRVYPCLYIAYQLRLANALRDMEAYEEAARVALVALDVDRQNDRLMSNDILSFLASVAFEMKDYSAAVNYYHQNLLLILENPTAQSLAGALNNLALAYMVQDSLEKSLSIFNRAYQVLDSANLQDTHIGAAILDNLSQIALFQGDTIRGFDFLNQKERTLSHTAPDTLRILDTWMSMAEIHLHRRQIMDAKPLLEKSKALAAVYQHMPLVAAYKLESLWFDYYSILQHSPSLYASALRLRLLHDQYTVEAIAEKAVLSAALRNFARFNVQQVRNLAEIQSEKDRQEQKFKSRNVYLWLSLVLLSLLSVAVYFYYRNQVHAQRIKSLNLSVKLNEQRLRNEQLEKELLQKNLDARAHDLTSVTMDNVKRREWTAGVIESLRYTLQLPPETQLSQVEKLYYHLMHQDQIQERLTLPQQHHDLINKTFFDKLKSAYPDLTENEMELCALIRLGLSGKEIAALRSVDPESIRKARYRLRRHLQLATPEDMRHYLNSL